MLKNHVNVTILKNLYSGIQLINPPRDSRFWISYAAALINGGFNKGLGRFRSKQIGCNKRLDLLTVDLLTEFHCTTQF